MIELRNVSFRYGPRPVLEGVDLAVGDGEYLGIVGPNGSGKSTLARLMVALAVPSSGHVLIDGIDTADPAGHTTIRRKVGLVFQNPDNQIVGTIVEDDVAFGPENLGLGTDEISWRVDQALAQVGLSDVRGRSPATLSGGQKQRLAVASMLAMTPGHLVLDEPVSMLDPVGRREVLALATDLNRRLSKTVVHIAHGLEEIKAADRVVVLEKGRIIWSGPRAGLAVEAALLSRLELDLPEGEALVRELARRGLVPRGTAGDLGAIVEALCGGS